jgi:hypothetical protein
VDCNAYCAPLGGNIVPLTFDNFLGIVLQLPRYFSLTFEVQGVATGAAGNPNILTLFAAEGFSNVLSVDTAGNSLQVKYKEWALSGPSLPTSVATGWVGVEIVVNSAGIAISLAGGAGIFSYSTAQVGNVTTPLNVLLYASADAEASTGGYLRNLQVTNLAGRGVPWALECCATTMRV